MHDFYNGKCCYNIHFEYQLDNLYLYKKSQLEISMCDLPYL